MLSGGFPLVGNRVARSAGLLYRARKNAQRLGNAFERCLNVTTPPIESQKTAQIRFTLNGEETDVSFAPYKPLLEVLREDLGHTGTKHGCELGECGACAVLLEGKPILSCLVLALECGGKQVLTVEGLGEDGNLHPLQEAFADLGAAQCGYCTPAILVTAKALLDQNPHPTRDQIREALSGNLCRCTGYLQIFEAVEAAVLEISGQNKAAT